MKATSAAKAFLVSIALLVAVCAKAEQSVRELAEQGDVNAQFDLGYMYDLAKGVPHDDAEAVKWYRRAADKGHSSAQFRLGLMYTVGAGVPQDHAEAVKWYRLAAEQGYDEAQADLGEMYRLGREGLPQDDVQAHMWFNLAAAQGHEDAAENRDIVRSKMTSEQIAEAQKLAREWIQNH